MEANRQNKWRELRDRMVETQIVARGIKDRATIQSMKSVPRHLFVPSSLAEEAYSDFPLPIGEGQTISQPYVVAMMTEYAEVDSSSTVLEIGTGSGYAAAVLAEIVEQVYTIERIALLTEAASARFSELGYKNIEAKTGDGTLGWPEKAPFDAVIVTAGAPVVPEKIVRQLVPGGRLVIPVGDQWSQQLLLIRKSLEDESFQEEIKQYVRFVPLIGEEGW